MTAATKLTGFAAALAVLFGGGALAGELIDPGPPGGTAAVASDAGDHASAMSGMEAGEQHAASMTAVRGLAVAEHGLRLALDTPELRRGEKSALRFRILDGLDRVVRDFDVEHTKRLHLIVVRRDLTGFRHLHPTQGADGVWNVPIALAHGGSYRVFADFSHDRAATTLAADLRVDGSADLEPLPAPAASAVSDGGYRVALAAGTARVGAEADLRFTVTKDGRAVLTQPYLGAGGHLVALREGDLAFLHVHPSEQGEERTGAISFETTFPSAGRYRLFLQFQVAGRVQTAAFTEEVGR
jgi:hypothetical protein